MKIEIDLSRPSVLLCECWMAIYSYVTYMEVEFGEYMKAEAIQKGHDRSNDMPVPHVVAHRPRHSICIIQSRPKIYGK